MKKNKFNSSEHGGMSEVEQWLSEASFLLERAEHFCGDEELRKLIFTAQQMLPDAICHACSIRLHVNGHKFANVYDDLVTEIKERGSK